MSRGTIVALFVAFLGAGVFAATLLQAFQTPVDALPSNQVAAVVESHSSAVPVRISIPVIGVDAPVIPVGIAPSGNMAVTEDADEMGWYRNGPHPGEVGSAVVNGHVENQIGLPGVFARLGELQPGDELFVENDAGEVVRFVVEETAEYAVADVPLDTLFNRSDGVRLNLITCAGEWLADKETYNRRFVAYARLAE